MRETLWISPDQTWAEGRWFWGEYQEFGVDVKLRRATPEPALLSLDRYSLKTGSQAQKVRVLGDNLPAQVAAADLDFGTGVTVKSIASHNASEIVAVVDVAADAVPGKRDVALRNAVLEDALAVYDKVDYIKVLPESSLARLGGDAKSSAPARVPAVRSDRLPARRGRQAAHRRRCRTGARRCQLVGGGVLRCVRRRRQGIRRHARP